MNTMLKVLVVAVMAAAIVMPAHKGAEASNVPTQYVALGDSFTQGIGAPVPAETGYVVQVRNRYFHSLSGGNDLTVNLAADQVDTTSVTVITGGQLGDAVQAISDPETDTELITLTVGGNDLLRLLRAGPCTVDPAGASCRAEVAAAIGQVAANYPTVIGTLVAAAGGEPGNPSIVVTTYYNPFDGTGSPLEAPVEAALQGIDGVIDCAAASGNPYKAGLNDVIACTAGAFGVSVADIHPLFEGRTLELTHIAEGDIHPNHEGHRVIANAVIDAAS